MSEKENARQEVRRLGRMLQGIAKTAREASLTGQLAGGKSVAIRQYNAILARLTGLGLIPTDLFAPAPEEASFDEVGVAATNLVHFLREDEDEERHRRWRTEGGVFEASPGHVKIVGFPGHIGEIGDIVREYLPDFLKHKMASAHRAEVRTEEVAGEGGEAGATEAGREGAPQVRPQDLHAAELRRRLEEVRGSIERISAHLQRPGLAPEEMQRLAGDLSRLAQEQANLMRDLGKV
jgi:hypothetical protein